MVVPNNRLERPKTGFISNGMVKVCLLRLQTMIALFYEIGNRKQASTLNNQKKEENIIEAFA
jgi:hypothetical protein